MKRYTMTQEELDALHRAAVTPGVFLGGPLAGYNPARSASEKLWEEMGEKYGFLWETARAASGSGNDTFEAEPKTS